MNRTTSPFSLIGGLLQLGAIVAAVAIGFYEVPTLRGTLFSLALIELVYVLVRFPQMAKIWAGDRIRSVKLVVLQLIMNAVIATVFYWLGRGIARHF